MHPFRRLQFIKLLGVGLLAFLSMVSPTLGQMPQDAGDAKKLEELLRKDFPDSEARVSARPGPANKDVFTVQGFAFDAPEREEIKAFALRGLGIANEPDRLIFQVRIRLAPQFSPEVEIVEGEAATLQAKSGRRIDLFEASRDYIGVQQIPGNPRAVRVTGKTVGPARVTITDERGDVTTVLVRVIPDISRLREELIRVFPRSNITVTPGAGDSVILTGYVDSAEDVEPILKFVGGFKKDVINSIRVAGVQQVQLEVCFATVVRSEFRRFGFNFLNSNKDTFFGSSVGGLIPTTQVADGGRTAATNVGSLGFGGLAGTVANSAAPNPLFFGVTDDNFTFLGFLDALRTEGVAKVHANPSVSVLSGRKAVIRSGGTEYLSIVSAIGQGTTEPVTFGTILECLPTVLADGRIRLEIKPEVSNVEPGTGQSLLRKNEQIVQTIIELENGQTFVLGGLLQNRTVGTTAKIPWLGDLPFYGSLFRAVRHEEQEVELIIMVTPRLVDPLDCSQRKTKLPGQETRSPTDFELFVEGILEAPRGPRETMPGGKYKAGFEPCSPSLKGCGTGCGHGVYDPCAGIRPVSGHAAQPTTVIEATTHGATTVPATIAAPTAAPVQPTAPASAGSGLPPVVENSAESAPSTPPAGGRLPEVEAGSKEKVDSAGPMK